MDNGTGAISDLISSTLPYIKNIEGYFFYIGITYIDKKTKILIENSDNMIMLNKNLKSRYVDQMLIHTIKKNSESTIFMPDHIGLFTGAIDIFKKNILIK